MAHKPQIMKPGRLKNRPDFLAAQKGLRLRGPLFLVEMRDREAPQCEPRIGFTVTRKQGNAVERNRMRRRLREAVRLSEGVSFRAGHDYVVVARRDVLGASFDRIRRELADRIAEGHKKIARHGARDGAASSAPPNRKSPGETSAAPQD